MAIDSHWSDLCSSIFKSVPNVQFCPFLPIFTSQMAHWGTVQRMDHSTWVMNFEFTYNANTVVCEIERPTTCAPGGAWATSWSRVFWGVFLGQLHLCLGTILKRYLFGPGLFTNVLDGHDTYNYVKNRFQIWPLEASEWQLFQIEQPWPTTYKIGPYFCLLMTHQGGHKRETDPNDLNFGMGILWSLMRCHEWTGGILGILAWK